MAGVEDEGVGCWVRWSGVDYHNSKTAQTSFSLGLSWMRQAQPRRPTDVRGVTQVLKTIQVLAVVVGGEGRKISRVNIFGGSRIYMETGHIVAKESMKDIGTAKNV